MAFICAESMRAMAGSELLARSRSAHAEAKRILLIDCSDQRMLEVIARGMALGRVEYYLTKPWRPGEHLLYPVIGEGLVAWTWLNSPGLALARVVGDHWDRRSFGVRDALRGSPEPRLGRDVPFATVPGTGRALLRDVWQPPADVPSPGVAVVYLHGSGYYIFDKDFLSRPLFQRRRAIGCSVGVQRPPARFDGVRRSVRGRPPPS